ncbi:MAG: choice-of-anchor D domain-containing protein, partial [Ktedonobacteraceae bacterium]|nr:choice-of-anchor D domain-containing protein [Ktedonobacteraceae bacterium]
MRHCVFCGTKLPEQAQFCGYCGRLSTLSDEWPPQRPVPSSTWSPQDEPTILGNTSPPTVIHEQTVLHPQPGERTLITPHNNAIWTPPVPPQSNNDEEQDRMRRARVWGIPLAGANMQGPSGAPVVQGTPQINGAPSFPNTPQPQTRMQGRYTPPPYPQSYRPQSGQQNKKAQKQVLSPARARAIKGTAVQWILVVATAVVVLTTAGVGIALAVSPSLSLTGGLSGKHAVVPGQHLSLHGSGFLPGGHIALKRDNGQVVQMAAQNISVADGNVSSSKPGYRAALSTVFLSAEADSSVTVNAAGTFDVSLLVGKDWVRGDHIIRATEDIFSRSATMTVTVDEAPPLLSVSPASLDFGSVPKGIKTSLSLAIGNSGGKPLAWIADNGGTKWLQLQSTSGDVLPNGGPQSLAVFCDTTSLALGTYSATIHVLTDGGNTDVKVLLRVVAQQLPKISVSTAVLDFQTMDPGQQATKTFSISNTGTQKLDWQVTGNSDWVSLAPTSGSIRPGSAPQGVNVQVDTTGLQAGSYSATLRVGSNGGTVQVAVFVVVPAPSPPPPAATPTVPPPTATPVIPTVVPTVVPQGRICDVPPALDFGTVQQGKTATLPLTLGNCGGTSLTWTAKSEDAWISLDRSGGTLDPDNSAVTINVTVDTTPLNGAKSYQGTV